MSGVQALQDFCGKTRIEQSLNYWLDEEILGLAVWNFSSTM